MRPPELGDEQVGGARQRERIDHGDVTTWQRALTGEALAMLRGHSWPGNVRELRTVIERAVLLGSRGVVQPQDIALAVGSAPGYSATAPVPEHATTPPLVAQVAQRSPPAPPYVAIPTGSRWNTRLPDPGGAARHVLWLPSAPGERPSTRSCLLQLDHSLAVHL